MSNTYVFYVAWPNATWDHELELTEVELWISNNTTEDEKNKILEEAFKDFVNNIDQWYYIKW